jgi:hypothetical protein
MSTTSLHQRSDPANDDGTAKVVGASVSVFAVAVVVYGLRMYSRLKPRPGYRPRLGWDDYAVSLGVVSTAPGASAAY